MLMLMLDEERTMKWTRDSKGRMNMLSAHSCRFIFAYCMHCMSPAEARLALKPKTHQFTEEQEENK